MIDTIFFWLGGTITKTIPDLILQRSNLKPSSDPFHQARIFTYDLSAALELGQISWDEYFQKLLTFDPSFEFLSNKDTWLAPDTKSIEKLQSLFTDLSEKYTLWLLSDFPVELYYILKEKYKLKNWFQDRTIMIPELGLSRLLPDIIYLSLNRACTPIENCLLIASQHRITSAAVRAGLSATIFVDYARLQREFRLRNMLLPAELHSQNNSYKKSFVLE